MVRPVKRLSDMEIDEISLVDKGANQHAMITIAKRAPEEDEMPDLFNEDGSLVDEEALTEGDVVYDEEGNAYQFVLDEDEPVEDEERELAEVGKGFGNLSRGFQSGVAGVKRTETAGVGANRAHAAGAHLNRNKKIYGAGAAGAAGGYAMKKSFKDEVLEELSKAYSDTDRDEVIAKALGRVEELESSQREAVEIAKSERDLRLTREYISKAAEYNLPVNPDELGPVLYRMADTMSFEDCSVIAKCLEAAGSMIFEEQGYIGGGDNADIMSQVEARAVELSKSADPVSITSVFEQSPEAYNEYLASQRGRY